MSGHGGCSGVQSVDVPAVARSAPPEVVSSSGSAPVGGLEDCNLILLVEDRVETLVGCPVVSSSEELEAELMAQSISCSAGVAQSCRERLRRPVGHPEEGPASCEDGGTLRVHLRG